MIKLFAPRGHSGPLEFIENQVTGKDQPIPPRPMVGLQLNMGYTVDTWRSATCLTLTLNRLQISALSSSLIVKFAFGSLSGGNAWAGEVKLSLPRDGKAAGVLRQRTAASITSLDAAELDTCVTHIQDALRMLLDRETLRRAGYPEREAQMILEAEGLIELIPGAIEASIEDHDKRDLAREEELDAARALFDSLPEGTPLIIRSSLHGGHWQLGTKRGKTSATIARNARIASPQDLSCPELRAAGLTAHRALPHAAAAISALAAVPEAARFQFGSPDLLSRCKLLASQPFHESYHSAKTAPKPEVWISTLMPSHCQVYTLTHGVPLGHPAMKPHAQRIARSEPSPMVTLTLGYESRKDAQLPAICDIGDLTCVNEAAKAVLDAHDLGGITLHPVRIIGQDGKELAESWHYLAWDDPIRSMIPSLCDPDFMAFQHGRAIKPFEITITRAGSEGRDLWWDDQRYHRSSILLSDRLYKALKKARCLPKLAFKPCEIR